MAVAQHGRQTGSTGDMASEKREKTCEDRLTHVSIARTSLAIFKMGGYFSGDVASALARLNPNNNASNSTAIVYTYLRRNVSVKEKKKSEEERRCVISLLG